MQKQKIENFTQLLNILIEYNLIKRLSCYDNEFAIGGDDFILKLHINKDGSINETLETEK